MLRWGNGRIGTLKDYIADCYPLYGTLGFQNWDDVLEYLQEKQNDHTEKRD